jgi:hypothetical protein
MICLNFQDDELGKERFLGAQRLSASRTKAHQERAAWAAKVKECAVRASTVDGWMPSGLS